MRDQAKSQSDMRDAFVSNLTVDHSHLFPILSMKSPKTGVTQPPFLAAEIFAKFSKV